MDFKVSQKETRLLPEGPVEVLVSNVCDIYPIFAGDVLEDIEILDDERAELLDRSSFSVMKQRGGDPLELEDGIEWAEAVMGEVLPPNIVQQVHTAVREEGPGVRAVPNIIRTGHKEKLYFHVELTNAV